MTRARRRALAANLPLLVPALLLGGRSVADSLPAADRGVLIVIPGIAFDEALAVPEIAALAGVGGAGLLANAEQIEDVNDDIGKPLPDVEERVRLEATSPSLGEDVRAAVGSGSGPVLVIVASDTPPDGETNDELAPVIMAVGTAAELFPEDREPGSLTSDSTRRDGGVAGVDVAVTFRAYLSGASTDVGARIRVIGGPPPFDLYERYLEQRRLYVPVGSAGAVYLAIAGLVAIALVAGGDRAPPAVRRAAGWACLSVAMLPVGLLATGHLPELTYGSAVPMVAIVTAFGTMAFSPLERQDATLVPAGIGLAVLGFFAFEAILGWPAMLTPLLGGSQLDGGRFYGFPNVAIGVAIGAALWTAHRLRTAAGVGLLFALGLLIGLPYVGANLGGSVTAFAAAGLWLAVRRRDRFGTWVGFAAAAGITALGTAVVLVAHAISPLETHVTNFEQSASGIGDVVQRFADRLRVGFDLMTGSPASIIPVAGLPVLLFVVLRPPRSIRVSFERWPAWRDAVLVTVLAGFVAYLVNDSGPAAAGFAFGFALGGMLGVSLLNGPAKMVAR